MNLSKAVSVRGAVGLGIGILFLLVKSTVLRIALLAGVIGTFFVLRKQDEGRAVQQGIVDFSQRLPGVGGWVSRKMVA